MGLTGDKCLIKIIFDFKIEICILEISNVPSFSKLWALLVLSPIWAETGGKYLIKLICGIKIEIGIFKISNVPNFVNPEHF